MTAPGQAGIQHTPLPWGTGLGRDTGAIANDPRQFDDLRNLLFYDGSVRQRGGLGSAIADTFTAAGFVGTDVCHVAVFKAQAQVIYVVFDAVSREVRVFTADLLGQTPVGLGSWGTLNAAADTPPRFLTAEAFGVMVFAHDEPNVLRRLLTCRYDPNATGQLTSPSFLHVDPIDQKKLEFDSFTYEIPVGTPFTKAGATITLAGLTVTAGTWGAMLFQIDAAGAVTIKVAAGSESYDTEPLALAALPAPDAAHIELGHVTIQAPGTGNWVAGINTVTTEVLAFNFYGGPASIWSAIEANLDGNGNGPVKFRGVREYLGFMLGWGYGTAGDPDRPEVLRISNGGDPAVFSADSFFNVGARGEPIVACAPVNNSLGVLKSVGWYRMDGTDRSNWEMQQVDPFTGCTSARGAINIAGQLWWWSQAGPVRSLDGLTTDPNWALGLDLTGPEPAGLPAKGSSEAVWVLFMPDERHVVFAHPNVLGIATRCYVVSARELSAARPQWAYWVLAGVQLHAAVINADQVSTISPGTASAVTTSGSSGATTASIVVDWTQNDMVGDEIWELWYQPGAGAWVKLKEFTYASVAGPTGHTTFTGPPLVSGTYNVQLRARRGTRYATGYEGSDPTAWPGGSLAAGAIIVIPTPTGVTVTYDFTDGSTTVAWTAGDPTMAQDVQITDTLFGHTTTLSVSAGTFVVVIPDGLVSAFARLAGGTINAQVRHKVGAILGVWAAAPVAALAYWNGLDIASLYCRITGERESVALGTDFDLEIGVPSVADGDWNFELDGGSNLGAYPPNGGCGLSFPTGSGYVFPSTGFPVTPLFDGTFPDSESTPVSVAHVPAFPCATCAVVGQVVGLGSYAAWWSFAKIGTLVHRTANWQLADSGAFNGFLPGSSTGFSPGRMCGP